MINKRILACSVFLVLVENNVLKETEIVRHLFKQKSIIIFIILEYKVRISKLILTYGNRT